MFLLLILLGVLLCEEESEFIVIDFRDISLYLLDVQSNTTPCSKVATLSILTNGNQTRVQGGLMIEYRAEETNWVIDEWSSEVVYFTCQFAFNKAEINYHTGGFQSGKHFYKQGE